jgi:hypothetical protein
MSRSAGGGSRIHKFPFDCPVERFRMQRGKKVVMTTAFLLSFLALGIAMFLYFWPKKGTTDDGPLAGFKVVNLPRTGVDIGSVWTQGIGPIRQSAAIPRLQSRSLQSSEIKSAQTFDASVAAKRIDLCKTDACS